MKRSRVLIASFAIFHFFIVPAYAQTQAVQSEHLMGHYRINTTSQGTVLQGVLYSNDPGVRARARSITFTVPETVQVRAFTLLFKSGSTRTPVPCTLNNVTAGTRRMVCIQDGLLASTNPLTWQLFASNTTWPEGAQVQARVPLCGNQDISKVPALPFTLLERMRQFQELVGTYRTLGYIMIPSDVVSYAAVGPTLDVSYSQQAMIGQELSGYRFTMMTSDPLSYFQLKYGILQEAPPSLAHYSFISLRPLQVYALMQSHTKGTVYVLNWLNTHNPVVATTPFKITESIDTWEAPDALVQALSSAVRSLPTWVKEVNDVSADRRAKAPWNYVYEPLPEKRSAALTATLTKLFTTVESIRIKSVPYGVERDRDVGGLHITKTVLERNAFAPVLVHGVVDEVVVQFLDPQKEPLVIQPTFPLAHQGESLVRDIPLSLPDVPTVTGFLFHEAQQPITTLAPGSYKLYTNMSRDLVRTMLEHQFSMISSNIAKVEEWFGFMPGDMVHEVYIPNAREDNAFFDPRNPRMIIILDERLKTPECRANTVRHETLHLLDEALGVHKVFGWQKMFQEIKAQKNNFSLFEGMNESACLPGVKSGGHAHDNEKEFFASVMNTMTHPTWETWIGSKDVEFQTWYAKTLATLKAMLPLLVNPKAPVLRDVQVKKEYVEGIIKPQKPEEVFATPIPKRPLRDRR